MTAKYLAVLVLGISLAAFPASLAAQQDARDVLNASANAMGAQNLRTLQYSGSGFSFVFAQAASPGAPWPRFSMKNYVRDIDFTAPASHAQQVRTSVDKRGGGGVGLPTVDQRQDQFVLPGAPWSQQLDIWITPYGFLQAAMKNQATVTSKRVNGKNYELVTFTTENKYKVQGYIDDRNMVERVQTWIEQPAIGDMLIEAVYSDYKDFGGLKFPTRIVQSQGGFPVLDLTVADVKPNVPVVIQAPQRNGGGGPAQIRTKKVADGVFYMLGGANDSVAVEFNDYVVMIEAPQSEERAMAFVAEIRKQIPEKPIKYVINTHHHFDHSGGIRALAASGAIIITQKINKPYFEKAMTGPRTLDPDALEKSGKKMVFETVSDKKVLTDGTHTIEIYTVKDSPHTDGSIMAYLPKEKMLAEADIFDMPGPGVPAVTEGPATAANLVDNIERLGLKVDWMLPIHSADIVPVAELYKAAHRQVP